LNTKPDHVASYIREGELLTNKKTGSSEERREKRRKSRGKKKSKAGAVDALRRTLTRINEKTWRSKEGIPPLSEYSAPTRRRSATGVGDHRKPKMRRICADSRRAIDELPKKLARSAGMAAAMESFEGVKPEGKVRNLLRSRKGNGSAGSVKLKRRTRAPRTEPGADQA